MRGKLDEQYNKDRETLDRMMDLVHRSKGDTLSPTTSAEIQFVSVVDRISNLISKIEGNFTMQDAWKFIKEQDPAFGKKLTRGAISTGLWRMKKAGRIEVLVPKKGISSAIYTKGTKAPAKD